jgi:aminopeptidase YwaD
MPLSDISVMVNCDMVGRYDPKRKLEIGGVGTGDGLQGIVEAANAPYGLALAWDSSGVAPSDNTSFFRKRVPVLFFFTGIHAEYHTPRDTPDTIEYAGTEKVVGVCLDTVRTLADRDAKIEFKVPPVDAGGRKAALGIQPATGSDSGGVVVASVADGGAAATAGLKEGDVIVAIGPYLVDSLRDLAKALTTMKPGDKVLVKVVRGTDHLAVDVVLGSRR